MGNRVRIQPVILSEKWDKSSQESAEPREFSGELGRLIESFASGGFERTIRRAKAMPVTHKGERLSC